MIIGWKGWFVDSLHTKLITYSSKDTIFEELPQDWCLGFVLFEERLRPDGNHYRQIFSSMDYYFKSGDIYGGDVDVRERNVQAEMKQRYNNPYIIRGIWTTDDLIRKASEEMRVAEWH
jgi:hypothetical protein